MKDTIRYEQSVPDVVKALQNVNAVLGKHGFDRKLHHLVVLRASQINGCVACVQMHTREAREDGETNERLDRVVVWKHASDFTEREKAALAWTEALTKLDEHADLGALRAQLRAHFTEEEIAILTSDVGMINVWNRLQIATH